jgi:hypothetical protein
MRTYSETFELATMCARNAHLSTNKQVARELWKMAQDTKPRPPNSRVAGYLILGSRLRVWKRQNKPR